MSLGYCLKTFYWTNWDIFQQQYFQNEWSFKITETVLQHSLNVVRHQGIRGTEGVSEQMKRGCRLLWNWEGPRKGALWMWMWTNFTFEYPRTPGDSPTLLVHDISRVWVLLHSTSRLKEIPNRFIFKILWSNNPLIQQLNSHLYFSMLAPSWNSQKKSIGVPKSITKISDLSEKERKIKQKELS